MLRVFVGRFFVPDVSVADLLSIRQKPNDNSQDYIKRWQREANKCCMPLSELEQVKLCRKGLRSDIALPLIEEIYTFKELVNNAHSKELLIIERRQREAHSEERKGDAVG